MKVELETLQKGKNKNRGHKPEVKTILTPVFKRGDGGWEQIFRLEQFGGGKETNSKEKEKNYTGRQGEKKGRTSLSLKEPFFICGVQRKEGTRTLKKNAKRGPIGQAYERHATPKREVPQERGDEGVGDQTRKGRGIKFPILPKKDKEPLREGKIKGGDSHKGRK